MSQAVSQWGSEGKGEHLKTPFLLIILFCKSYIFGSAYEQDLKDQ